MVEGPVQISRENGQRRIGIELNVAGRDIGGFVAGGPATAQGSRAAARRVLPDLGRPVREPAAGDAAADGHPAGRRVALIFVLLLMTFRSVWLALLVLINLPFATVGGVFALLVWGLYLSVPASVGFIVLFGVAVLNGLVLVSYISQLRAEGETVSRAPCCWGARRGCRAVLMTASIAIFSLIPMVFATGPGSEVQRPLAVVVIGGLRQLDRAHAVRAADPLQLGRGAARAEAPGGASAPYHRIVGQTRCITVDGRAAVGLGDAVVRHHAQAAAAEVRQQHAASAAAACERLGLGRARHPEDDDVGLHRRRGRA